MFKPLKTAPLCALVLVVAGCAGNPQMQAVPRADAAPGPDAPALQTTVPNADREAILEMIGEYRVTFAFDETVPLVAGYQRREPKRSGADEVVLLVSDTGDHIVLQHLLVVGDGQVIKHWRQDWTWQADQRLEFVESQTWRLMPIEADRTRGAWTQCVFGVADTPRYCGTGRWNHRYGNPTWTSDRTWRPLPRREYTTREDYNALNVENRHTITPEGWTHEQDNTKVLRDGGETEVVLVREFGFNNYIRTDDTDFEPAYTYWDETDEYWATVRDAWQRHFESGGVRLATGIDAMPIIEGLFDGAEQARDRNQNSTAAIEAVFGRYVVPVSNSLAQTDRESDSRPAPDQTTSTRPPAAAIDSR